MIKDTYLFVRDILLMVLTTSLLIAALTFYFCGFKVEYSLTLKASNQTKTYSYTHPRHPAVQRLASRFEAYVEEEAKKLRQ